MIIYGFGKGCTKVAGKVRVQLEEVKIQSSFTRSGSSCIVLQVKFLPLKGISTKSKSDMTTSLKRFTPRFILIFRTSD
jgi:hypothetical protein